MADQKEKPEEAILFPEVEINGINVKPWTFGKLFQLATILDSAITKLDAAGIDIEGLMQKDVISYTTIARMFAIMAEEVLEVIKISVDISQEDIEKLDMETGIKLAFTIFNQNKETIKNAFTSLGKNDKK